MVDGTVLIRHYKYNFHHILDISYHYKHILASDEEILNRIAPLENSEGEAPGIKVYT